jgi:hypothetical protein
MGRSIVWQLGVKSDYRRIFWRAAWQALRRGQIEAIFNMGFVCHHLIRFTREALNGEHTASFYDAKARDESAGRSGEARLSA